MSTLEDWDEVNHLGHTHGITNMIHYIGFYPFNVYWVVYSHHLIHVYLIELRWNLGNTRHMFVSKCACNEASKLIVSSVARSLGVQ